MKKLHKILGLLLAAATVVSLSGCHSLTDEQKEQLEKIEQIKESIGKLTPTLVNDFEQPKDFYVLQGSDQSGVYVGKEMAHSGKQSAKVWIQEEDNPWSGNSAFIMPLKTGWRGDLSDISLVKSIGFWVYNAQDEPRTVTCKMELPSGASVKFSEEVQGQVWTQIFYDLKREQIPSPRCENIIFSFQGNIGHESVYFIEWIKFYRIAFKRLIFPKKGSIIYTKSYKERKIWKRRRSSVIFPLRQKSISRHCPNGISLQHFPVWRRGYS